MNAFEELANGAFPGIERWKTPASRAVIRMLVERMRADGHAVHPKDLFHLGGALYRSAVHHAWYCAFKVSDYEALLHKRDCRQDPVSGTWVAVVIVRTA